MDFEYYDIITIKGKKDNDKPQILFFLRGSTSHTTANTSLQYYDNGVTHSRAKLVLKGPTPSTPNLEQHEDKTLAGPSGRGAKLAKNSIATSYSVLNQLK